MKPYRPSNGTEGAYFQEAQCGSCVKHPTCKIPSQTMRHKEDDAEYPKEWVKDDDGSNPRCTAREERLESGDA